MKQFVIVTVAIFSSSWHKNPLASDVYSFLRPSLLTTGVNKNPLDMHATTAETIEIDHTVRFQTMEGFGFCLTGGSAMLLRKISDDDRQKLLEELFSTKKGGLGISALRISMGASDMSARLFTYNDIPFGSTDVNLTSFSLADDLNDVVPVLKQILLISPQVRIVASPWTAPLWMKTWFSFVGGSLNPAYFRTYANYFVKYVQSMSTHGINIDAVTIQNEALYGGNNPSMFMDWPDQLNFVKNHLGPAFRAARISTKIIIYDHNPDRIDYPISILNDPVANQFIDGTAFHAYEGSIDALETVHKAHPTKHLYFTEQWMQAPGRYVDVLWQIRNVIIGASRNWCKIILQWNLATDENWGPHTSPFGCDDCLGAITINGSSLAAVTRNSPYSVLAHASRFVPPGSVRINSTATSNLLPNAAFSTASPGCGIVVIVLNDKDNTANFDFLLKNRTRIPASLGPGEVATYCL